MAGHPLRRARRVTSNSLIGNYYGVDYTADGEQTDPWAIDWSEADCGYGITQVTDGMRLAGKKKDGETAMTPTQAGGRRAGLHREHRRRRADPVGQVEPDHSAGMKINDGHPQVDRELVLRPVGVQLRLLPDSPMRTPRALGRGLDEQPGQPAVEGQPHSRSWRTPPAATTTATPRIRRTGRTRRRSSAGPHAPSRRCSARRLPGGLPRRVVEQQPPTAPRPSPRSTCSATARNYCDPSKISDGDSNDPGQGACTLRLRQQRHQSALAALLVEQRSGRVEELHDRRPVRQRSPPVQHDLPRAGGRQLLPAALLHRPARPTP